MEPSSSQRMKSRDRVLSTQLPDGGSVLLDLEREEYFGLNAVGSELWQLLLSGAATDELIAHVLADYDVDPETAATDVRDLVERLQSSGLIEPESV